MPKMLLFAAPSGAGKTTIVRRLLQLQPELAFSVSATTRAPRAHEQNGIDYYFLTQEEFQLRVAQGAFVEWEEVYEGLYYGTLHEEIHRLWKEGKHIVFDIDVKGALNIKKAYGDAALAIFVKPPSPEVLFERLRNRNTETEESLNKRISRAAEELAYEPFFDYVLLNDDLDKACDEAAKVTTAFMNAL